MYGAVTHAEIYQQPGLWPTTVERVKKVPAFAANGPTLFAGAGTSAYAAGAIAASWPSGASVPTTDLLVASNKELGSKYPGFDELGAVVSLARSGDSPESIAVVSRIQRAFPAVKHLAITCNAAGRLAKWDGIEKVVLDPRTNDQSLAMTSSFSNLVLAGLCLRRSNEIEAVLHAICKRCDSAMSSIDKAAEAIASRSVKRVVVLASGAMHPMASEACLKILEMTAGKTVTMAETFAGLRHGPMSFLEPETVVICYLSSSAERRRYEEDLIEELRAKKLGHLVGIAPAGSRTDLFDLHVAANASELPDELRVPFEIPFAQLLGYHLSLACGLNPDNPSPSGILTRVVQSFRIHDGADV